ncbi:hypothetical protein ACS0TY_024434 [Phlomoides rotata]
MNFTFVLSGWEGSAADSRVLRDAVTRPNGLRVPNGCYYLCDDGYTNCNGFLAPYRGVRYHLKEWDEGHQPQNHQEYFNMKHARARKCIERAFGILKVRWGILRSNSYYPTKPKSASYWVVASCTISSENIWMLIRLKLRWMRSLRMGSMWVSLMMDSSIRLSHPNYGQQ